MYDDLSIFDASKMEILLACCLEKYEEIKGEKKVDELKDGQCYLLENYQILQSLNNILLACQKEGCARKLDSKRAHVSLLNKYENEIKKWLEACKEYGVTFFADKEIDDLSYVNLDDIKKELNEKLILNQVNEKKEDRDIIIFCHEKELVSFVDDIETKKCDYLANPKKLLMYKNQYKSKAEEMLKLVEEKMTSILDDNTITKDSDELYQKIVSIKEESDDQVWSKQFLVLIQPDQGELIPKIYPYFDITDKNQLLSYRNKIKNEKDRRMIDPKRSYAWYNNTDDKKKYVTQLSKKLDEETKKIRNSENLLESALVYKNYNKFLNYEKDTRIVCDFAEKIDLQKDRFEIENYVALACLCCKQIEDFKQALGEKKESLELNPEHHYDFQCCKDGIEKVCQLIKKDTALMSSQYNSITFEEEKRLLLVNKKINNLDDIVKNYARCCSIENNIMQSFRHFSQERQDIFAQYKEAMATWLNMREGDPKIKHKGYYNEHKEVFNAILNNINGFVKRCGEDHKGEKEFNQSEEHMYTVIKDIINKLEDESPLKNEYKKKILKLFLSESNSIIDLDKVTEYYNNEIQSLLEAVLKEIEIRNEQPQRCYNYSSYKEYIDLLIKNKNKLIGSPIECNNWLFENRDQFKFDQDKSVEEKCKLIIFLLLRNDKKITEKNNNIEYKKIYQVLSDQQKNDILDFFGFIEGEFQERKEDRKKYLNNAEKTKFEAFKKKLSDLFNLIPSVDAHNYNNIKESIEKLENNICNSIEQNDKSLFLKLYCNDSNKKLIFVLEGDQECTECFEQIQNNYMSFITFESVHHSTVEAIGRIKRFQSSGPEFLANTSASVVGASDTISDVVGEAIKKIKEFDEKKNKLEKDKVLIEINFKNDRDLVSRLISKMAPSYRGFKEYVENLMKNDTLEQYLKKWEDLSKKSIDDIIQEANQEIGNSIKTINNEYLKIRADVENKATRFFNLAQSIQKIKKKIRTPSIWTIKNNLDFFIEDYWHKQEKTIHGQIQTHYEKKQIDGWDNIKPIVEFIFPNNKHNKNDEEIFIKILFYFYNLYYYGEKDDKKKIEEEVLKFIYCYIFKSKPEYDKQIDLCQKCSVAWKKFKEVVRPLKEEADKELYFEYPLDYCTIKPDVNIYHRKLFKIDERMNTPNVFFESSSPSIYELEKDFRTKLFDQYKQSLKKVDSNAAVLQEKLNELNKNKMRFKDKDNDDLLKQIMMIIQLGKAYTGSLNEIIHIFSTWDTKPPEYVFTVAKQPFNRGCSKINKGPKSSYTELSTCIQEIKKSLDKKLSEICDLPADKWFESEITQEEIASIMEYKTMKTSYKKDNMSEDKKCENNEDIKNFSLLTDQNQDLALIFKIFSSDPSSYNHKPVPLVSFLMQYNDNIWTFLNKLAPFHTFFIEWRELKQKQLKDRTCLDNFDFTNFFYGYSEQAWNSKFSNEETPSVVCAMRAMVLKLKWDNRLENAIFICDDIVKYLNKNIVDSMNTYYQKEIQNKKELIKCFEDKQKEITSQVLDVYNRKESKTESASPQFVEQKINEFAFDTLENYLLENAIAQISNLSKDEYKKIMDEINNISIESNLVSMEKNDNLKVSKENSHIRELDKFLNSQESDQLSSLEKRKSLINAIRSMRSKDYKWIQYYVEKEVFFKITKETIIKMLEDRLMEIREKNKKVFYGAAGTGKTTRPVKAIQEAIEEIGDDRLKLTIYKCSLTQGVDDSQRLNEDLKLLFERNCYKKEDDIFILIYDEADLVFKTGEKDSEIVNFRKERLENPLSIGIHNMFLTSNCALQDTSLERRIDPVAMIEHTNSDLIAWLKKQQDDLIHKIQKKKDEGFKESIWGEDREKKDSYGYFQKIFEFLVKSQDSTKKQKVLGQLNTLVSCSKKKDTNDSFNETNPTTIGLLKSASKINAMQFSSFEQLMG